MTADFSKLITSSGLQLMVRSVEPSDDAIINNLFRHVQKEDLRFRFLSTIKEISLKQIQAMTRVDHKTVETYLAFVQGEKIGCAAAVLASDSSGKMGEVAISVRSEYRDKGIGWELLSFVALQAKKHGMTVIQSIESRENHDAIQLEREMGFSVKAFPGDSTLVLLSKELGL